MPSSEHVSRESSRLVEVKLQEHWSCTTAERLSLSDWVLLCSSDSCKFWFVKIDAVHGSIFKYC